MSVPAAGEQQKLRGSCHACALSKVRCSKEKPICSRCTKRGTPCEYLVTRRPGRKQQENRPNARASASITNVQQTLPQPDVPTAFALPEDQPLSVPNTSSSSNFDMLSCLFDTVDPSLSTALMDWSTDFDGYLAVSPVSQTTSFDVLDPSQTVSSARTGSRSPSGPNGNSAPALVRPDDTISLFGRAPASGSQSSPNTHPLLTNNPGQSHRGSTCSCFPCALDLLKDIVASDPMRGPMSEKRTSECVGSSPPSIDTTIKTNQQTMDTINTILECGCSQDSYLLAIVALIIFKVLDTYATAATALLETGGTERTSGSNDSRYHSLVTSGFQKSHWFRQKQLTFMS